MTTKEKKDQVIELRKQGKTYLEIRKITGVPKSTISNICKSAHLEQVTIKIDEAFIKKAQDLYDSGCSLKEVCKKLKVCSTRLSPYLKLRVKTKTKTKVEAVVDWRKRTKQKLIEYKGGKCEICGYNKCVNALEFHHKNPLEKDFQISGSSKSFENLKSEVDKCLLVCANCHREIHAGLIDINNL